MGKIPELSECNPGIEPMEYNVLIAPESAETVTKGGIIIPEKAAETNGLANQRGRLVAMSPHAFSYAEWPDGARKPRLGDAVIFAKYAGALLDGADCKEYRVIKDKDLIAIIVEQG